MTVTETAKHFRVDRSTVNKWISKGCPCVEWGSAGRSHGHRLDLDAVQRWRVAQLVPTLAQQSEADVLAIVETALLDSLKRDDLATRTKTTEAQVALAVLIIFERVYRNVKQTPLEPHQVPEQLRHLCTVYLDSVERGRIQRR